MCTCVYTCACHTRAHTSYTTRITNSKPKYSKMARNNCSIPAPFAQFQRTTWRDNRHPQPARARVCHKHKRDPQRTRKQAFKTQFKAEFQGKFNANFSAKQIHTRTHNLVQVGVKAVACALVHALLVEPHCVANTSQINTPNPKPQTPNPKPQTPNLH